MFKLLKGGINSTHSNNPDYYDISSFDESQQTGYIEKLPSGQWKMYISNAHVLTEHKSESGKHYFSGSLQACIREVERLTNRNVIIKEGDDLSLL